MWNPVKNPWLERWFSRESACHACVRLGVWMPRSHMRPDGLMCICNLEELRVSWEGDRIPQSWLNNYLGVCIHEQETQQQKQGWRWGLTFPPSVYSAILCTLACMYVPEITHACKCTAHNMPCTCIENISFRSLIQITSMFGPSYLLASMWVTRQGSRLSQALLKIPSEWPYGRVLHRDKQPSMSSTTVLKTKVGGR